HQSSWRKSVVKKHKGAGVDCPGSQFLRSHDLAIDGGRHNKACLN
ncbi:MAG: hypothetical protein ACI90E_002865, partial [Yoonia sp.]